MVRRVKGAVLWERMRGRAPRLWKKRRAFQRKYSPQHRIEEEGGS